MWFLQEYKINSFAEKILIHGKTFFCITGHSGNRIKDNGITCVELFQELFKFSSSLKFRSGKNFSDDLRLWICSKDIPDLPFKNINEYYSTTFHELTHSTGHKNRLNRLQTGAVAAFGSETYSKEELVAEIGSASLMNMLGIETPKTFRNSAAYIQSWLKVLRNDNKFIVSASSKAEKAVNYIMAE